MDKPTQLKTIIGLDSLPPGNPARGVIAPWTTDWPTTFFVDATPSLRLLQDTTVPIAPGEVYRIWVWGLTGSSDARVRLEAFVSSTGPATARERLVSVTTNDSLPDMQYTRGPSDLGDASAVFLVPPVMEHVAWAYHNVCISLRKQDESTIDILGVARRVQTALAQYVIEPIGPAMPRVDRVEPSSASVHPDERMMLHIRMKGPPRELLVGVFNRPDDVRVRGNGLELPVSADLPGKKDLTLVIADPSTLLSTTAQASFVVVP